MIREGCFGKVYKGRLDSRETLFFVIVAIKQLNHDGLQGSQEFIIEVLMLSFLHHSNLMSLIGYCDDGDEKLLVYEYMAKGSLEDHLFTVLLRIGCSSTSTPMASLLFPSAALTSKPKRSSLCLSSSFKGNASILRPSLSNFAPIKLGLRLNRSWKPLVVVSEAALVAADGSKSSASTRFRLDNLGPQPGSRKKAKRKGRGIAAGQGASCGFGMRGQKSRSGPGVRRGFEGGQMPLYRRIPKLRGIAGGMHAGLPKYVPVNLKDIETAGFEEGEEVSLETLREKGLINPSGRERRLPLKVLGHGELSLKLNIKARAFSASAKEKLEAAGCSLTVLPGRKKWVKPSVAKNMARADEYFAKKRAAAAAAASEANNDQPSA